MVLHLSFAHLISMGTTMDQPHTHSKSLQMKQTNLQSTGRSILCSHLYGTLLIALPVHLSLQICECQRVAEELDLSSHAPTPSVTSWLPEGRPVGFCA